MKKIISIILALTILCAMFVGCDSKAEVDDKKEPTNNVVTEDTVQENEETDDKTTSTGEITMEMLMSHPESPVEDFEITEYEEGKATLLGYLGDDEIVVIPESLNITHIEKYAFANDCCVKAVRLSNTVQVLEEHAFGLNENLELFVCGNGLVEIGDVVFQNCTNLRELVLNDGLVKLGKFSVGGCSSLLSLDIPATVTELGYKPFYARAEGFTIIGEAGSCVEQHATEEGIPFQAK